MKRGSVLDGNQMVADPALVTERAHRLGAVVEQRPFERGIAPGLGNDARAGVGADLGLVGLDDEIERSRIDVALLGQDRFQRAHAQLRLGELRPVFVVVVVLGHGKTFVVPSGRWCNILRAGSEVEGGWRCAQ